jgi:hypothetical protein
LAVLEDPDSAADVRAADELVEAGKQVVRLLDDPRLLPAAGRAADAPLIERADGEAGVEQVLADRREEDVVIARTARSPDASGPSPPKGTTRAARACRHA